MVLLGCGPPATVDRDGSVLGGGGSPDGREAGSRGGSGGSALDGGGMGGSAVAGAGGASVLDGGIDASSGGASGSGGTSGNGGQGGSAGMSGSDANGEFDIAFAPDVPLPPGPPDLARGRVGHWKLDEGMGNVGLDSSGIGNHAGTVNILGPDWKPGKIGTALQFTPMRRTFLTVPSHETIGPTEGISLSVWVNAASWAGSPRILQKGEDDIQYSLRAENNMLRFVLRLAAVTAVEMALPPPNQWVHVAATYDGQTMRLYQNGNQTATLSASGAIAQPFTALQIATRSPSAADTEFFAGLIDEVIIYERPLSAAEVRLLSEGKSP